MAILLTLAGASPVGVANAQTAHFSGAVSTLGSGFLHTFDVAVDGSGNVFVADYGHNAIKEILAAGGYTTVNTLGSGFYYPTSVAVDGSGNVFVADEGNSAIKEIVAAGGYATVNTLGSGFQNPSGVAVDGSGNVFVADMNNNAVKEILAAGGYTTVKTLGNGFVYPWKVAVDGGGNVFVADYGNNAVKEILAVGGYTAVNTLGSGFTRPSGVSVDGSGNVFVADQGNNAVKEIVAGTGGAASGTVSSSSTVSVLGSGFGGPTGVAVDNNGNVFVADYGYNAVKKIATRAVNFGQLSVGSTTSTASLTFYFDTGGTIAVPKVLTQGTAGKDFTDAGTGTCTSNGSLHVYNAGDTCTVGVILTPAAPGLRLGAAEILDGSGNNLSTVYMSGTGVGPQINFLPGAETLISVPGSTHLVGAAVDAAGNVYAGDSTVWRVSQVAGGTTYLVANLSGYAVVPQNLAVDGAGNVLITDPHNGKIWTVPPGETLHTFRTPVVLTSALTQPEGVAVDGDGNIYIADAGSKSILKMSPMATGGYSAPSPISTITPLNSPYGIEVDGAGNLYIADFGGNKVVIKFASGIETVVSTNLNLPRSLAVDDNGNIYIANSGDANILRAPQTAPGVWGTPTAVTTTATLAGPTGVAVDGSGNLYITDSGVTQVVEKQYATAPTYTFGTPTPLGYDYSGGSANITVFNFGNAPLTAVAPGLTPAPDFPQSGGTCTSAFSLVANDICTLNIGFHPLTAGALNNEHFTLTDNNLGVSPSLQSITLSGVGIPLLGFAVIPATPVSLGGNAGVVKVNELGATFAVIPTATDSITLVVTGPAGYTATYSATAVSGVATFDLSAVQLSKAGNYGYVAHLTSVTGGPTASVTEVVNKATPTIAVTSAGTPTTYGTPVTFSATVTGVAGNGNPSGNVVFYSDGTAILNCGGATGLAVTAGAGVTSSVSCTTSALTGDSNGHSVTAQYLGDTAYGTSAMSNSLTQKVNVTSSVVTISLTTGTTPANYGTPLVFTATVYGVSGLASATGTVTFVDGVTPIACTNAPSNVTATTPGMATATCNISTLGAGSHSITARYVPGSDPNYSANDSSALAQDVNSLATTLALVSSAPAQSSVNQSVTFTATVTVTAPPSPPALAPTGSVSFTINGSSSPDCPNATLSPTLTATCTTSSLKTPSGAIRATYIPDANYSTSSAGPLTQTVNALTPTLSMIPSPASPQPLNTSVTFTATLSGATLTPVVPGGTVTFMLNGTTVAGCTGEVNSAGVRTCVIQNMPAGSTPVTATYSGDTNFVVAAPGSTTFWVNALPGTLSITPSPGGSVVTGTSVTFTAQLAASSLSPITPSGTVTFTVNGSSNADCPPKTVTARGAATCTTSSLQVPSDVIQATYSGDTNFTPVTAGSVTETVAKSPAQTTLTSSVPSASVNQQVTFTATVKPQSGTVLPTGSVTFAEGTTTLCAAVAINSSTGIATCSYPFASVTAGATITATYSGDQNFDSGTPGTAVQAVVASSTSITIASAPNPSTVNQQVALTAVLTPTYTAGNAKPTGTVTFTNTSTTPATTLCGALAIVNGVVPVCNYAFTSAGGGNLVATFTPGDSNFTGSVSSTDSHPINAASTTVVLTTSPSPVVVNQQTTLTATINTVSGTTKPQGTIIYTDTLTSTTLCTVTLTAAGSVPTCPYSFSTTGTHTITASFTTSDSNFLSSVSTVLSVPVNKATTTTSVSSSPNSSTVNQQVAFTASVTPAFTTGTAKPTGTVTFVNTSTTPATTLCAGLTIANGIVPVCNFTFSSAGSSDVVATYNGDSNFSLSSSAPAGDVQVVATGSTGLVLTSTPSTATANQQVTFTATVTATPSGGTGLSGTVAFTDNGSAISGCSSVPVVPATGVATCLTASMTAGSHTILATYGSDPNFGSSNNTIVQTPSKLTPTLGLSSTGASSVGAPVTITAQLSGVPLTPNAPTGTAAFTSNGVTISDCAAAPVDSSGKAICTTSALSAGSDTIGAVFSGDANFSTATAQSIRQTVAKIAPTVALALTSGSTPSAFGTILTFTATTTGVAGVPSPTGTVSFTDGGAALACLNAPSALTAAGSGMSTATCNVSALNVGTHQIAATYDPGTDPNYLAAGPSAPVSQTVNQAAPKLLLTCAEATYDGNAHSCVGSAAGISGETVAGSWSYSPSSSINAGSSSFTGTFTSSDANYVNGTASGTLVINPATTLLTLTCPETIYDGSVHSCTGSAKGVGGVTVAGTWSYAPSGVTAAGITPVTGTFTRSDPNYSSGTASGTLTIDKGTPQITWVTPASITYGTPLSGAQLNASSAVAGSFSYSPVAGSVLSAGTQTLTATLTPTDSTDYISTTRTVSLAVTPAGPTLSIHCTEVAYDGNPHTCTGTATGLNGLAVTGTWSFNPASATAVGSYAITGTFTSTNPNYANGTADGTLKIDKFAPVIVWAAPTAITYGTPLSGTQLNATSVTQGSFAYSPAAGTVLTAGSQTLSVTFTPTNSANYAPATKTVSLTVNQALSTISWATPAPITFGTALNSTQLNATASVPGTFTYNPPAGTIPTAGNNTLSVQFTPTDSVDFLTATASVTLTVNNPVPIITSLTPALASIGGAAFTLTLNGQGFTANSTVDWANTALATQYVSATQLTAQVPASAIAASGTYAITVKTAAPGGGTSNAIQFEVDSAASGTVTPPAFTTLTATVTAGSSATYAVTLPSAATDASVTCLNLPSGATCSYSAASGAVTITTSTTTPAGTYQITVVFTETLSGAAGAFVLLPFLLLPLVVARRKLAAQRIWVISSLGFILMIVAATSIGCGGGGTSIKTPSATHQVTSSGVVTLTVH